MRAKQVAGRQKWDSSKDLLLQLACTCWLATIVKVFKTKLKSYNKDIKV